jgi:hypothetical protein
MWFVGVFRGAEFQRLRPILAGTFSAAHTEGEEAVEVRDPPSGAVRDFGRLWSV